MNRTADIYDKIGEYEPRAEIVSVFKNVKAVSGVAIPKLLVALGLFPDSGVTGYGNDRFWARNNGERLPFRGSAFGGTSNSGPSALNLSNPRSRSYGDVGFRSAFVE